MDCSSGETATIYNGIINFKINKIKIDTNKKLPIKLMMNIGSPDNSFNASLLPNDGVGLARLEFIISNYIKIHPLALLNFSKLNVKIQQIINKLIYNYKNPTEYFIIKLARGIAKIATAFYPKQVIVRLSDFKSNEYKNLIGGTLFEPNEENPMIGWRGASRYYSEDYKDAFILECKALYYAIII